MIAEKALALAGPRAHLVRRPRGRVAHVYVGPLTPSGRYVPRAGQTVCRAHTGRLSVLSQQGTSLEHRQTGLCPVCARCSARLGKQPSRRAGQPLTCRADWVHAYASTTKADVAFALELAQTPAEVDAAAHLSLVLFQAVGCNDPFTHRGREWRSLHQLVHRARGRVGGFPESQRLDREEAAARSLAARDQRRRENKAAREEREQRVDRLGINLAEPARPRRRR